MKNPVINISVVSFFTVLLILTLNGRTGTDLLDTFVERMEVTNSELRFDLKQKQAAVKGE